MFLLSGFVSGPGRASAAHRDRRGSCNPDTGVGSDALRVGKHAESYGAPGGSGGADGGWRGQPCGACRLRRRTGSRRDCIDATARRRIASIVPIAVLAVTVGIVASAAVLQRASIFPPASSDVPRRGSPMTRAPTGQLILRRSNRWRKARSVTRFLAEPAGSSRPVGSGCGRFKHASGCLCSRVETWRSSPGWRNTWVTDLAIAAASARIALSALVGLGLSWLWTQSAGAKPLALVRRHCRPHPVPGPGSEGRHVPQPLKWTRSPSRRRSWWGTASGAQTACRRRARCSQVAPRRCLRIAWRQTPVGLHGRPPMRA